MKSTDDLPRILLFDLGGVLVEWDGVAPLVELAGRDLTPDEVRKIWLYSPAVRAFERGRSSAEEFASGIVRELELPVLPERFLAEFATWVRRPLPGALQLLDELETRFTCACLSNNNSIHWRLIRDDFGFGSRFEKSYLSHEMGLIKPDAECFEHVVQDLGVAPARIAFFDDSPECVEAAARHGFRAFEVRGVDETREAIASLGGRTRESS